ncbi:hypothetical protein SUGI_0528240 [Cryptomeria japonica]|uniref:brassinosteroid-related acyltransferase 1 n=1 Tax=Cryptomeria japonica TaxID=3369 RepID=UPI002408B182|nr:brassinosteroid-related acyltransferase 1 [Cryptomeria japonica]GLJ26974.1 hypothetical protein SUGI_0528240 [Cryptomeria japonica]
MGCEGGPYVSRDLGAKLIEVVSVYPLKCGAQDSTLKLSNLDRKCPMLMYTVFFYRPSEDLNLGSVFQNLKEALEKTLTVWYPAAGRLKINENDGKLDLLCNSAGAFMAKAFTDSKFSELGDLSQYNPFFEELVYKPAFDPSFSQMPLMVAQLTKFTCGGFSLGFGTSHSLFDGLGAINFLKAWASAANSTVLLKLPQPLHERTRLLVTEASGIPSTAEQNRVVPFIHLNELIERGIKSAEEKLWECNFNGVSWASQSGYALKTFSVSKETVQRLKTTTAKQGGPPNCSAFDVVAAHLWKARVKALGLSCATTVCLQFTVDARSRLVPPLPREFSGNAYVMASVTCTVEALEKEGLHITVDRIRKAKDSVTDEYIRYYLRALDAPQKALPSLRELTLVSDWRRTPFHAVDFGMGKALYAAPLASPVPQSAYFLQDPNDEDGIHVRLGLLPEHVAAFHYHFTKN